MLTSWLPPPQPPSSIVEILRENKRDMSRTQRDLERDRNELDKQEKQLVSEPSVIKHSLRLHSPHLRTDDPSSWSQYKPSSTSSNHRVHSPLLSAGAVVLTNRNPLELAGRRNQKDGQAGQR